MKNRSKSGRYILWSGIIKRLKKHPGRWSLELPDRPSRTVATVRLKRSPDLRQPDGHVEAKITNEYRDEHGWKRGDIHLRWVYGIPTHQPPTPAGDRQNGNEEEGH